MNDITQSKAVVRAAMRKTLKAFSNAERREAAALAVGLVQRQPAWLKARSVLLFAPMADELDIWPLVDLGLAAGKQVALPRFDSVARAYTAGAISQPGRDLVPGQFAIREPKAACPEIQLNRLDLVLAPGLAFDLHGFRLGRGKGFYDRLLSSVRGTICGVAYDVQVVSRIPAEPHDIHVDCILTPTRWIDLQVARRL